MFGRAQIAWVVVAALVLVYPAARRNARSPAESDRLMVEAGLNFLAALRPEQKGKCLFPFSQEEWEKWHYIPMRSRVGIRYDELTADQVHLADLLVASGLSRSGYFKAKTIMSLEQLVLELEAAEGRSAAALQVRNPAYYYFAIYGEPSRDNLWGWRVEGHHISFHFTLDEGVVRATTPMFLGAEPHRVLEGPRKGLRVLAREEDLARSLLLSLSAEQREKAILAPRPPSDIFTSNSRSVDFSAVPALGLKRSDMTGEQQEKLAQLIEEYVANVPPDLAEVRRERVQASGDEIYFAWMGDAETGVGHPHYYRVHARTFLIEYDNTQNNGNHSHSVWRDYDGDFGRDWIALHYRQNHK